MRRRPRPDDIAFGPPSQRAVASGSTTLVMIARLAQAVVGRVVFRARSLTDGSLQILSNGRRVAIGVR